jgi:hypothetical protein
MRVAQSGIVRLAKDSWFAFTMNNRFDTTKASHFEVCGCGFHEVIAVLHEKVIV